MEPTLKQKKDFKDSLSSLSVHELGKVYLLFDFKSYLSVWYFSFYIFCFFCQSLHSSVHKVWNWRRGLFGQFHIVRTGCCQLPQSLILNKRFKGENALRHFWTKIFSILFSLYVFKFWSFKASQVKCLFLLHTMPTE